jgi:hypothetical protein
MNDLSKRKCPAGSGWQVVTARGNKTPTPKTGNGFNVYNPSASQRYDFVYNIFMTIFKMIDCIRKNKWRVGLAAAVVLAVILGLILFSIHNKGRRKINTNNVGPAIDQVSTDTKKQEANTSFGDDQALASLPSCGRSKEVFSTFPVKEGDYSKIIPLGNLNPSSHTFPTDHIYVEVYDPQRPAAVIRASGRKSLIAPADMWIYKISNSEQVGGITDWAIDFSPCKDVKGKFGHVGTIADKLQAAIDKAVTNCNEYKTGGHTYKSCDFYGFKLKVESGEEIGTAGSERSGMLDIWMSDYREPEIPRANPARWSADRNYVACFLDYFKASQKDQFYKLLIGPNNGVRTKEPRCGTVNVDIPLTAQGVWFYNLTGKLQNEDQHLALVYENMETDKQTISMGNSGNSVGLPSASYQFVPVNSGKVNRNFSQVSADSTVYCYDTKSRLDGVVKSILLTMPSSDKLRIGSNPKGKCGSGTQTLTNFVEFAR